MALTVSAASAVTPGQFVAGILDGPEGRSVLFVNAAGTPLNGIATSLPTVGSVTRVSTPGTSDNAGPTKLVLTPNALDTVNASSVQAFTLDQNAYVIVASTNNG
jgi:hypothetical protein